MILVDAHVHIYDCFNLQNFLDSALENFETAATRCGHLDNFAALLLLSETSKENWFQSLADYARNTQTVGRWTFQLTRETVSIWAQRDGGRGLFVVAGRQIMSEEGLEVLALITDRQFEDGLRFEEAIQAVKKNGAIPVIPWGFGKWMGARGEILGDYLGQPSFTGLFLGDNGGRPAFWPYPAHFRLAESRGLQILRGSDPLPLDSETWRAGSFGVAVHESISFEHPGMDLKAILEQRTTPFLTYGNLEHPYRFLRNQLAVRVLRKRSRFRGN